MIKNTLPLVSICIPSYNYANYISAAIESILGQTYRDFELIIVDDCSRDNTEALVRKYAARNKEIRFYRNETNLGMVENWNRCLELARGAYVKMMGADDLLEPSCIERSAKVLDENHQVALVSCARLLIDDEGWPFKNARYSNKFTIGRGRRFIRKCFFTGNIIGEPVAVMFRKKDLTRGFDTRYRQLTDLEMWFHLLEKGDFAFIPEPLCRFRVHQNQTTKTNVASLRFIDDELLLYHDYIRKDYLGDSLINRLRWKFKLCYTIWMHKFIGMDVSLIRSRIRQYIPLYLFYPLAYLKLLKDKALEVMRNMTYCRTGRCDDGRS